MRTFSFACAVVTLIGSAWSQEQPEPLFAPCHQCDSLPGPPRLAAPPVPLRVPQELPQLPDVARVSPALAGDETRSLIESASEPPPAIPLPPHTNSPPAGSQFDSPPATVVPPPEWQQWERDRAERVNRLRAQLDALRHLIPATGPASATPGAPSTAAAGQAIEASPPPPATGSPAEPPTQPTTAPAAPSETTSPPTASDTTHPALQGMIPDAIVDAPANRLSLADNLYAANETALALQIYQQLRGSGSVPQDLPWVEYQIAGCYRRLGNIPEAEKHYRTLVGVAGAERFSDPARWWLSRLDRDKALQTHLQQMAQSVKTLEEEIRAAAPRQP